MRSCGWRRANRLGRVEIGSLIAISTLLLWLDGGSVCADDGAPPAHHPSKADVSAAEARFKSGKQMIASGDYAGAIGEIEQAYELDPRSEHLFNIAVAYQYNAERDKAMDYYRRYLAAAPDGKLAADAGEYLRELETQETAENAKHALDELDELRKKLDEVNAARERPDSAEQARPAAPVSVVNVPLPPPPPPVWRGDQGVAEDAIADRGWVMPTALTAPAGTWTLSDVDLFVASGSYAVTDQFTMTIGALLPFASVKGAGLGAKLQLVRSGRVRVATQGLLAYTWSSHSGDGGSMMVGNAGSAVTLCVDTDCRSHLSGYLGLGLVQDGGTSGLLVGAGSLALALSSRLKIVFELENGAGYDATQGSFGWYGVRITSRSFALDLGGAKPLGSAVEKWGSSSLPFLSLTVRSFAN